MTDTTATKEQPPFTSSGWQPIETVPLDVRWVMVWRPALTVEGLPTFPAGPVRQCFFGDALWTVATHWMPLPDQPATSPMNVTGHQSLLKDGDL